MHSVNILWVYKCSHKIQHFTNWFATTLLFRPNKWHRRWRCHGVDWGVHVHPTFARGSSHTHTHTHPFNGPFPGLPGWAGTRKVKPIWILLKQEIVSGSGIRWTTCTSASRSRQITMPVPHHSFFYRPDALPAAQPTASKHWRQIEVAPETDINPTSFYRGRYGGQSTSRPPL